MFGSGQWTIWEGYAASKFMKAGLRSNNIGSKCAPLYGVCCGSVYPVTFGIDEPMGCYDDLELADTFVLWGANMAEDHLNFTCLLGSVIQKDWVLTRTTSILV
ncbi:hypothetical protein ACJJIF_00215 (plasmid) [Microbulbifer sp. SSSA002]|uniref:hypothetical protein n=1 Tax=Microbulbifer sp. SSSA002 TaxID=3243376 RepID=UPI004039011D